MEKDDETDLVARFEVVHYPSFVWTDAKGTEVLRSVLPADSAEMLEELEAALEELTAPADEDE